MTALKRIDCDGGKGFHGVATLRMPMTALKQEVHGLTNGQQPRVATLRMPMTALKPVHVPEPVGVVPRCNAQNADDGIETTVKGSGGYTSS